MANTTKDKTLLKGGEFLVKDTDPENVFIPEDIGEESQMIREMCQEFLEKEVLPHLDKIDKHEDDIMVELLDKAGELGVLGLSIPEKYNGYGKGFNDATIMSEVFGAGHSFPVSLMAHNGIGILPILYFGTEEQKEKYLPKLAQGEWKGAYALTEPDAGSDALSAKSKAVLSDDGKHYLLNGQKIWITNSGFADVFVVFAKVEGGDKEGFTGFIVQRSTEGLSVGEEENKMGIKGSSTRQVFFEDCQVPVDNVLGEVGKGHLIAFNILNIGRFKLCAATVGAAKRISSLSVQYANERQQFGQSISSFGAIQHKLAEQAIRTFATESALYRTSDLIHRTEERLLEEGESHGDALKGAAKEYAVECAILKVLGSEALDYVVDEGVQIYGGYGFSEEYPMARAFRDARINRIFEGTNEINRLLTVDMLVKRTMKGEIDLMGPAKEIQDELMSIPDSDDDTSGLLGDEKIGVKKMKKAALMVAGAAVQEFMEALEEEQEIIMGITDMIMEVYTAESVLLRTLKLAQQNGEDKVEQQIAMTKVGVRDAIDRL